MNISISNIAWDQKEADRIATVLHRSGVRGVDVSPTKVWRTPETVSDNEIRTYRQYWTGKQIRIIAVQSLLFHHPELQLFGDTQTRRDTVHYLSKMIALASALGAGRVVFGSPKNRRKGSLTLGQTMNIAVDFFHQLGEIAFKYHVLFCIEPLPQETGCDFVTTAKQGIELVKEVHSRGFGLLLDSGAMTVNGEEYGQTIEDSFEWIEHIHISEPNLALVGSRGTDHKAMASALRRLNYTKWVSVEMLTAGSDHVQSVSRALDFVTKIYE